MDELKRLQDSMDTVYSGLIRNKYGSAKLVDLTPEDVRWEKLMANKWKHQD